MNKEPVKRSTIWDAKTRTKRKTRKTPHKDIRTEVDEGFRYFWSRRKVSQYHSV